MKCYYDTIPFTYFFFKRDTEHEYSPIVKKNYLKSCISVFTSQEFLHHLFKGDLDRFGVQKSLVEVWRDLSMFEGFFEKEAINLNDVRIHLYDILGGVVRYRTTHGGFPEEKLHIVDGMDWLHLCVADLMSCEAILTPDKKFENLEALRGNIPFKSLNTVVLFDPQTMSFIRKFNI
jgi:hypothetical protein